MVLRPAANATTPPPRITLIGEGTLAATKGFFGNHVPAPVGVRPCRPRSPRSSRAKTLSGSEQTVTDVASS
jgi:hypothetical protein